MNDDIRVAIVGVGNCASSLVQGVFYYNNIDCNNDTAGLITNNFKGYFPSDIKFVAAFDIDRRKINKDLSQAIFEKPNCTKVFNNKIPILNCNVEQGILLDGVAPHLINFPENVRIDPIEDIYKSEEEAFRAISNKLKEKKVDVLVNYVPVGSEKAAYFYARCCLEAHVAFVNAMPVFISSEWGGRFRECGVPILGDDIKSQVGATLIHRALTKLSEDRGVKVVHSYQLNVGGNSDFLNMLDKTRLKSKKISKTQAVSSQLTHKMTDDDLHIGPSDYIPWLKDNKVCFIRMECLQFGDIPMSVELRLSVEDSPNSAGVIVDAIRAAKVSLDRKLSGPIIEASSYLFKSPVVQYEDSVGRDMLKKFASLEG